MSRRSDEVEDVPSLIYGSFVSTGMAQAVPVYFYMPVAVGNIVQKQNYEHNRQQARIHCFIPIILHSSFPHQVPADAQPEYTDRLQERRDALQE